MAENKEIKKAADKAAKPAKEKKPGWFSKLVKLFKESKSEVKKITWSDKKSTTKNTILVIVSLVIIAVIFGLFDMGFRWILEFINDLY